MANNQGSTIKSFITGLALGSIAALLLAPFSGRKMRRLAKEKGKNTLDDAKKKMNEFEANTLRPKAQEVKSKGVNLWNRTKDEVNEGRNKLGNTIQEVGSKVSDVATRAGKDVEDSADEAGTKIKR